MQPIDANYIKSKILELKKRKRNSPNPVEKCSNIIQLDDMGYPLLLCIMRNGEQRWIDVNEDWADAGLKAGSLKLLEWRWEYKGLNPLDEKPEHPKDMEDNENE